MKYDNNELKKRSNWDNLLNRSKAIPNLSDKAFIHTILIETMPASLSNLRNELIEDAILSIENIPSYTEKAHRFQSLGFVLHKIDPNNCKDKLKKAIENSIMSNSKDIYSVQRRIIDFAHKNFPDFVKVLVTIID